MSETIHGYTLLGEWKIANISDTNKAERGGKTYFLKRYTKCKKPIKSDSISESGFQRQTKRFNDFKNYRTEINKTLRELTGEGGNIIAPREEFEYEIYFAEATEFVPGLLEGTKIYTLSSDELRLAMMTIAASVYSIHRKKIVHSDLKLSNIAITKSMSGRYVGKILDFDMSYFEDRLPNPDHIGGDAVYLSPELAACFITDFSEEYLAMLSTKSDIFSLGLVFYNYLTKGDFPKLINVPEDLKRSKGDGNLYCGEGVACGAKLLIEKKIKEPYLRHLIAAMLQEDPKKRPDAVTVQLALKNKSLLSIETDSNVVIEGESDTPVGGGSEDDSKPGKYCLPWDEHNIDFDLDAIKRAGFICTRRSERKGVKCYEFEKADGKTSSYNDSKLKLLGFAYPKGKLPERREEPKEVKEEPVEPVKTEEPVEMIFDGSMWGKDSGYIFDMDAINKAGFEKVGRTKKDGKEVYVLETSDGKQKYFPINNMKLLGYVKKKEE